jgi:hypothetical protein
MHKAAQCSTKHNEVWSKQQGFYYVYVPKFLTFLKLS